jgi:short subunit dehydrogenase-like uncharacterized protein
MTNGEILIYGASGYTAQLIIERATLDRAKPILAGRSPAKTRAIADQYNLSFRVFGLEDPAILEKNLTGIRVVLNCAGPYSRTAMHMAQACMKAGVHYLDITGEIDVFESLSKLGNTTASKVMLMPGTGFDVVPSDCLAAHLKHRMPDATSLTLAFQAIGTPSHGTATTMIENLHRGGMIRRNAQLTPVPAAWASRQIDFGSGPVAAVSIPLGDIATAWVSTGIANIDVFMSAPATMLLSMKASRYLGGFMATSFMQKLLKAQIDKAPAGPNALQRSKGESRLWGEVRNARGQVATARLNTMEAYSLTAQTAWDITKRTANGEARPGFQTPSMVFGADYILNFPNTTRTDL